MAADPHIAGHWIYIARDGRLQFSLRASVHRHWSVSSSAVPFFVRMRFSAGTGQVTENMRWAHPNRTCSDTVLPKLDSSQGVRPLAPTIRGHSLKGDYVSVPVFRARGTLFASRLINSVETGWTPSMVSAREAHRIVLELAIFRSRQTDHQRRGRRFLAGDADRCQCPIFLSGERTRQLPFTSMEIRRIG